ncbi:MAG: sodium/solute symporter [Opitutaceae bacterium]|nr:sodium/solute symporter [Cephaloticoccus sp.]MCP5530408.1 sodium/solute symporter [Opitutaceae bacterium]
MTGLLSKSFFTLGLIGGLHWVDILIIAAYLSLLVGIGAYFSAKQSSVEEFMRGGAGKFGWLALGFSLMAALNSGGDYVQTPAVVYGIGMVFSMGFLSWVILYPYITRVTVPFYRKLNIYSAYEYLEKRFDLTVRIIAASIFIMWRVGWMSMAIYVPCLAVNVITGNQLSIGFMVLCAGTVVTLYTMLGGMKAVFWTDVAQFFIMFGGLGFTLYTVVSGVPGGLREVIEVAAATGKISLIAQTPALDGGGWWDAFSTYMTTEVTLFAIVLAVTLSRATAFTADQVAIQRFQSSGSIKESRQSYIINAVSDTVWMFVLAFVGLALIAYYQHHALPEGIRNDQVFLHFIRNHFPIGITGLVISAIFAASLSSIDAALNSSTSIIMVDFYNRLLKKRRGSIGNLDESESNRQLWLSRIVNLSLGLLMILIGSNLEQLGEIYQAANKILGAFFGPLFGIFVLGMFSRRANSIGVVIGSLLGLLSSCFASFFSELPWLQHICGQWFGPKFVHLFANISWLWPSPIGITVTLVAGYLASRLVARSSGDQSPLTFREVMRQTA